MAIRNQAILFGDSITEQSFDVGGWGARLANHFSRRLDVVNRGCSGYTTQTARHLLPAVFPVALQSPALVTVFFGANDAAENDMQHVPVAEFEQNLAAIVLHLQNVNHAKLIVIVAPPPNHSWPDRTCERTELYAIAAQRVATEHGCLFVDALHAMQAETEWHSFLSDGLHLSTEGNAFLFNLIRLEVGKVLPLEELVTDFPLWRDMPRNGTVAQPLAYKCWYAETYQPPPAQA